MSHIVLHNSPLRTADPPTCRVIAFNKKEVEQPAAEAISLRASEPLLAVPTSGLVHVIKERDLMLIEASGNYTTLYLNNDTKITTSRSIKHIEKVLSTNSFLRIHQSYMVNKVYVTSVQKDGLMLSNGRELNIARSRRKAVQTWLSIIRIF